jgi:hypothetical protein
LNILDNLSVYLEEIACDVGAAPAAARPSRSALLIEWRAWALIRPAPGAAARGRCCRAYAENIRAIRSRGLRKSSPRLT